MSTSKGGHQDQMISSKSSQIRPFIRWAGSKSKLLRYILPVIPPIFGRYYEPFLGSGALFFALRPTNAVLSDISKELVDTWISVRDRPEYICQYLEDKKPSKDLFYEIRNNRSNNYPERACEFIYLNKTCWNGLYRVNKLGQFNVPYGAPKSQGLFNEKNLLNCSRALRGSRIKIKNSDFEIALRTARKNDLVFLDPPYVTKHNFNGFRDWNENLFQWSDQERLARIASKLADRGVYVIVSNAAHKEVAALYKNFTRQEFTRSSTLASDATKRIKIQEVVYYSF